MSSTVLVIAAHTDDETLGMGGAIQAHRRRGDRVCAIAMTNGVGARGVIDDHAIRERATAADKAAQILDFEWAARFDFPDNAMDRSALLSVVQAIETVKADLCPEIVYTHSAADLNVDHRITAQAALTAFRPQPGERCCEIRLFEVASATDYGAEDVIARFSPNLFIGIADNWAAKAAALDAYGAEMRPFPHSRSVDGLRARAVLRGVQAGLAMAEAFQVIRKIEP
ncbi:MAG: PIG-L family deacetylase [Pseudomonadota bacterium]